MLDTTKTLFLILCHAHQNNINWSSLVRYLFYYLHLNYNLTAVMFQKWFEHWDFSLFVSVRLSVFAWSRQSFSLCISGLDFSVNFCKLHSYASVFLIEPMNHSLHQIIPKHWFIQEQNIVSLCCSYTLVVICFTKLYLLGSAIFTIFYIKCELLNANFLYIAYWTVLNIKYIHWSYALVSLLYIWKNVFDSFG